MVAVCSVPTDISNKTDNNNKRYNAILLHDCFVKEEEE